MDRAWRRRVALVAAAVVLASLAVLTVGTPTAATVTTKCASAGFDLFAQYAQPGDLVAFNAASTTCTDPEYKFFVRPPHGSWTAMTGYGPGTWSWQTPATGGTYGIGVWARQKGSTAPYEAYWLGTFDLLELSCDSADLMAIPGAPQPAGTTIAFTATSTRCPNPRYRFLVQAPGSSWSFRSTWSSSNSWAWHTAGLARGLYQVGVWVREATSPHSYDAYSVTTFTIGSTANCSTATLTPALPSPEPLQVATNPGLQIELDAGVYSCGTIPPPFQNCPTGEVCPLFMYWLKPPGLAWGIQVAWTNRSAVTWDTTHELPGTYELGVWVKPGTSTSPHYSSYFIRTFTLTRNQCTAATINTQPTSPQPPGTTIAIQGGGFQCGPTGADTGGSSEFWILPPGGTWQVLAPYIALATGYSWDTTGMAPGPYQIGVWVSGYGLIPPPRPFNYDSYAILTFWVGT